MTARLVVEVGVEELPAQWVEHGARTLTERLQRTLADQGMKDIDARWLGTPRRLTAVMESVPERAPDREQMVRGPAAKAAYDEEGNPTKAALGFARGQNVDVTELFVEQTTAGSYVHARRVIEGRPIVDLMSDVLPDVISGVDFPISMRWGEGEARYGRPVRWLVVLYGETVIPVRLEDIDIESGRVSRGHRSVGEVVITAADDYERELEQAKVIAGIDCRREQIRRLVRTTARQQGAEARIDPELLAEVNCLVEYPAAVCGLFDPEYLQLPAALLITVMQSHQRYFPLQRGDNEMRDPGADSGEEFGLYPGFVCVVGGGFQALDQVRAGHERVLKARLEDAAFFVSSDRERSLADRVADLFRVVFIDKAGTVGDRVERLVTLSGQYGASLNCEQEVIDTARQAARLAKADLTTHVVSEFPELAGLAGRIYALASGEPEETAVAVGEHVLPRYPGDRLPGTMAGALVGLADRFDALVGFTAVGIRASGSHDPYGLRRQALAIITLCETMQLSLSLADAVTEAIAAYGELPADGNEQEVRDECLRLLGGRMRTVLEERGFRHDVIDATVGDGVGVVPDCIARADALQALTCSEIRDDVITVFRRTDQLGREGRGDVNPELFEEDGERELWSAVRETEQAAEARISAGDYGGYLELLSGLRPAVDRFFDDVLVMVEDDQTRQNRLNMLGMIARLCRRVGDLSELVVS